MIKSKIINKQVCVSNHNNELFVLTSFSSIRIIDKNKIECWQSKKSLLLGIFYPNIFNIQKEKVFLPNEMIDRLVDLDVLKRVNV